MGSPSQLLPNMGSISIGSPSQPLPNMGKLMVDYHVVQPVEDCINMAMTLFKTKLGIADINQSDMEAACYLGSCTEGQPPSIIV
jgi:hypothetical protein